MRPLLYIPVIAVTVFDHYLFGCAHCESKIGVVIASAIGTAVWKCSFCHSATCLLPQNFITSTILFFDQNEEIFSPQLQTHPFNRGLSSETARRSLLAVSESELPARDKNFKQMMQAIFNKEK